jgi:Protein of unknown function (DUF3152)
MKSLRSWSWGIVIAAIALIIGAKTFSLNQKADASAAKPVNAPAPTAPKLVQVPQKGSGVLITAAGAMTGAATEPSSRGKLIRVRVQMEEGLSTAINQEPSAFANGIIATLNDDRSWSKGGKLIFVHSNDAPDATVILATPETTNALCRPLRTLGRLSCSNGTRAVLNARRWVEATPEFTDLQLYRHYLVNHEVGHILGHRHQSCPGPGKLAPVMQQQTKRVAPCLPNAWPNSH